MSVYDPLLLVLRAQIAAAQDAREFSERHNEAAQGPYAHVIRPAQVDALGKSYGRTPNVQDEASNGFECSLSTAKQNENDNAEQISTQRIKWGGEIVTGTASMGHSSCAEGNPKMEAQQKLQEEKGH